MMISQNMCQKLGEQVTNEFHASQTYLAMACLFENKALQVLAKHFRKQSEEERGHALKLISYVLDQGGTVELQAVPAPTNTYASVQAALDAAVAHEKRVTQQINDLCTLAVNEKDYASKQFLDWFVEEQVEEVNSAQLLADVAKMCGSALLHLEAYLIHTDKAK